MQNYCITSHKCENIDLIHYTYNYNELSTAITVKLFEVKTTFGAILVTEA